MIENQPLSSLKSIDNYEQLRDMKNKFNGNWIPALSVVKQVFRGMTGEVSYLESH
jgi:hypothetical protein